MKNAQRVIRLIVTLAAAVFLADTPVYADSGGLTLHGFDRLSAKRADARAWKIVPRLEVNIHKTHRLVVPDKCEDAGKAELIELAAHAAFEESYAFVPALCLWVEVGYDETKRTVRADTPIIDNLLRDFPALAIYHIHVGTPKSVTGYFPGYSDLLALLLVGTRFQSDPNVQVIHRAVTVLGIIEYRFVASGESESLLEALRRTGLGAYAAQNLAYEYARARHKAAYYEAVRNCGRLTGEDPARLADCFPMKSDAFEFHYERPGALGATR